MQPRVTQIEMGSATHYVVIGRCAETVIRPNPNVGRSISGPGKSHMKRLSGDSLERSVSAGVPKVVACLGVGPNTAKT